MCLGIPGEIVELMAGHEDLAMVSVEGVQRAVNIGLLRDEGEIDLRPGDWILIHVGFALSKIDEAEAKASLEWLTGVGDAYTDELAALAASDITPDRETAMKFVDEFRDAATARALATRIAALCEPGRRYTFMEVCGGHTHTIYKHGLEDYLPETVSLVHGPGCPVCVIPMGRVDDAIAIAEHDDVIMTSFGDMMRVPGGRGSFFDSKAAGADIRMVYSPLDALKIARKNPDKRVVFMAIGFETTAPVHGDDGPARGGGGPRQLLDLLQPRDDHPGDQGHPRLAGPAAGRLPRARSRLHGDRLPAVRFIARDHGKPLVCAGFEPLDILQSVHQLLLQLVEGRCEVENQYSRVVPWDGNAKALRVIGEVMELRPHFEWRGLGFISHSALRVREQYAAFDAERIFAVPGVRVADPKACQCGEVLKGVLRPWECKVFGTACTPETPIGTCMVSSEGACAAYYNFGRFSRARVKEATRV